jgi:hypothetical protein
MVPLRAWCVVVMLAAMSAACGSDGGEPAVEPIATQGAAPTATAVEATATVAPSPTPEVVRQDIRVTRLSIPSIGIDSEVQGSETIPYVYVPPPGCPDRGSEETETVTVPNQGIATPEENLPGLENKAWVFGHSRWLGTPGVFLALQNLDIGDEVIVDGRDRMTGEEIAGRTFVVDGFYLADTDSGELILNADAAEDVPREPVVVLQTSVREDGAGKAWILDRQRLIEKATNVVEGDLEDPCKYLLLFVTASPAP